MGPRWRPQPRPNAGPGQPQTPLGRWAVDLRTEVENRVVENPILACEVLPEIRNWCDPLGPERKRECTRVVASRYNSYMIVFT